jgi:hypothetical protein
MANGETASRDLALRAALALFGATAGLAFWYVGERLAQAISDPQLFLFVAAFAGAYFTAVLGLVGPVPLRQAALAGLAVALPAAGLLVWASLRHETLADFAHRPEPFFAFALVVLLPLPYLIAALRPQTRWRDYPTLFGESWGILVRLGAALLFAGIAWLALTLSDQLLHLVGIDLIGRLLAVAGVPHAFIGAMGGLALAIVIENAELVSADLFLRLLRLLALPAVVVVGAFTVMVPVQGLSLFGALSPAATLLGIALFLTLAISSVVDADDAAAAQGVPTRLAAQTLALFLPVVAGLGLWAIWLRFGDEGLSPPRLAAALAGLVLLSYGLLYAGSVLGGRGWTARIRGANGWMGVVTVALAALWLTPALDAERLSAQDQLARFVDGRVAVEDLDLWTLRHDWGRAGQSAVARIEAMADDHPEADRLRERLALSAQAPDRFAFRSVPQAPVVAGARAELRAVMPVRPPEAEAEFDRYVLPWYAGSVGTFLDGCRDLTQSGRPGCVLVVADLIPGNPGNEAILFYKSFGLLRGEVIVPQPVFRRADAAELFAMPPPDFAETDLLIEQLQDGHFSTGPARINAITIGERQFTVPF